MLLKTGLCALYSLAALCTVYAVLLLAPWLETKYWPVVSKMQIDQMYSEGLDKTRVMASFTKLRNCDYLGIAWYRGSREFGFMRVPLELMRQPNDVSSPNRPLGRQNSGPWIVSIPATEIYGNSFVELYHQCTPFWVTRTEFFP